MKSSLAPQMSSRLRKRTGRAIKRGLTCWKTTSLLAIRNSRPVAWLDITPGWGRTVPRTRTISLGGDKQVSEHYPFDPDLNPKYFFRFNRELTWATLGGIRSTGLSASRAIAEYCAQTLYLLNGEYSHLCLERKKEVVMPKPIVQADSKLKIGQYVFRPTHKLSERFLDFNSWKFVWKLLTWPDHLLIKKV